MWRALWLSASIALSLGLQAAPAARPVDQVSTLAGTPGLSGFHDDDVHLATLSRPTWLAVVVDEEANTGDMGKKGDIYVVDRANQVVRRVSGGKVSTVFFATGSLFHPVDFGGPLGGGILIEPAGSGCGSGEYDRGIWIAASGSEQIPLIMFTGSLASRDAPGLVGSGSPGAADGQNLQA